jgi:two-component system, OmpR family, phosphate regulon sensor histidine kinase PhoR
LKNNPFKNSIFLKIFAGYFALIAVISIAIPFIAFEKIKTSYVKTLSAGLTNLCYSLQPGVVEYLKDKHFTELDLYVKELGKNINTRITVIDPSGLVLADSLSDPKTMENHAMRPEIAKVLKAGAIRVEGESIRFSATLHENMLYIALPLYNGAELSGVIRVSMFLRDINNLLGSLEKGIVKLTLVIIFVSLLGAFLLARSMTMPIRKLRDAAQRLSAGSFESRVRLKNTDEIGALANTFNTMAQELGSLVAQLKGQKEEIDAILSSIQEGLFVIQRDGKIALFNEGAKKIFSRAMARGRFYWEIIRDPKFEQLVKKVNSEEKNVTDDIELDDKTYLCSLTPLSSNKDIVALLLDITQVKQINKIKKDLVLNVSHELRTPLTAIKGFVETLEESIGAKNKNYLEIIKRHTERLINIVNDLMLLSELEEKGFALDLQKTDLVEMAENIAKMFEPRLREKSLKLSIEAGNGPISAVVDKFKIEQALINLIDNAVKYTEQGEIKITLSKTAGKAAIVIQDTGIGIPSKDLARIFERFYVVDKSRSRKAGGTGLGLSIVKHIVLLHNGELRAESAEGSGSKFTIELPQA